MIIFRSKLTLLITLFSLLFSTLAIASSDIPSSSINDYKIITEYAPPFNYNENSILKGISVEILDLILKDMKSTQTTKDIVLLPWARGYSDLKYKLNTMLFSTNRLTERETLFKWVGPIVSTKISILAPKSSNITISNFKDLKKYLIGTVKGDAGESILLINNIPKENISPTRSLSQNIKKLTAKRIDLICYEEHVLKWSLKKEGKNFDDYEIVYVLKKSEFYYAFNKNTPDSLIDKVQQSLNQIKESPDYQRIIDKYLK